MVRIEEDCTAEVYKYYKSIVYYVNIDNLIIIYLYEHLYGPSTVHYI